MLKRFTVVALLIMATKATMAYSQVTMQGGRGLLHVHSANVVNPADIYVNTIYSNFFEKIRPEKLATYHTLYLNGTIGLAYNLEFNLHLIPYQEDQDHRHEGQSDVGIRVLSVHHQGLILLLGLEGVLHRNGAACEQGRQHGDR